MSKLLELAERCEQATGPDRELDAAIAATLRIGTDHGWAASYPAWEGRSDGRVYLEQGGPSFAAPAYTASLDAAMTLVPEGCWDHMEVYRPNHQDLGWTVYLLPDANLPQEPFKGFAQSHALALTAAALRAHAAMEEQS